MIDIHTHILPGVDDGARTLEEAIEMCRMSARDGVHTMVATPHAHDEIHTTHDPALLQRKTEELNAHLEKQIRVVLGCELRFTHASVEHICVDKTAPTIAGGPYALIEFPHSIVPPGSERALFELMGNGVKPIIAHPERNMQLMAEPERLYELIEMGALGQLDSGSMTGQFGSKVQEAAHVMLEHMLVHIIASDCHNTRNRLPGISAAVKAAAEVVGDEYAATMAGQTPEAVVEGKPIPFRAAPVVPTKKRKRWVFF